MSLVVGMRTVPSSCGSVQTWMSQTSTSMSRPSTWPSRASGPVPGGEQRSVPGDLRGQQLTAPGGEHLHQRRVGRVADVDDAHARAGGEPAGTGVGAVAGDSHRPVRTLEEADRPNAAVPVRRGAARHVHLGAPGSRFGSPGAHRAGELSGSSTNDNATAVDVSSAVSSPSVGTSRTRRLDTADVSCDRHKRLPVPSIGPPVAHRSVARRRPAPRPSEFDPADFAAPAFEACYNPSRGGITTSVPVAVKLHLPSMDIPLTVIGRSRGPSR